MRRLWQSAIICLLAWFLTKTLPVLWRAWQQLESQVGASTDFKDHAMGIGYLVTRDRWVEFALPPGSANLRILVNPSMDRTPPGPETPLPFSLAYALFDKEYQPLSQGEYHFLGKYSLFNQPGQTGTYPATQFEEDGLFALDPRAALLKTGQPGEAAFVRFKLQEPAGILKDLVLRAYVSIRITPGTEMVEWQRMNQAQKMRAARARIENYHYMDEQEIMGLVREQWRPIGPTGIKNRDYHVRHVFTLRENPGQDLSVPTRPPLDGMLVGASRHALIPLPEGAAHIEVRARVLEGVTLSPSNQLHLVLHRDLQAPRSWQVPFRDGAAAWTKSWAEGDRVLEVFADLPSVIKALHAPNAHASPPASGMRGGFHTEAADITPLPLTTTAWLTEKDQPLSFALEGSDLQATPFRLTFFPYPSLDDQGSNHPAKHQQLSIDIRDAAGKVVAHFNPTFPIQANPYDFLHADALEPPLGMREDRYFRLPPGSKRVEVTAFPQVLVTAALRPADLPLIRNVPQDYADFQSGDLPLPAWFTLDPLQADRLRAAQRNIGVFLQQPAPQVNPLLNQGNFWIETYQAQPRGPGRYLYLQREADEAFTPQSAGSAYSPVPSNQTITRTFIADAAGFTAPSLLFRLDQGPATLGVWVDGTLRQRITTSAPAGELPLGALAAGPHRILVETEGQGRFFLNHLAPSHGYLRKLLVDPLLPELSVTVEKPDHLPLVLAVRVFSPFPSGQHTVITTHWSYSAPSGGPYSGISVPKGRFRLSPASSPAAVNLGFEDDPLDEGVSFFLELGEDLPPGSYQLLMRKESGPGRYLRISRVAPLSARPTGLRPGLN